jgi:hypothetical protein
MAPVLFRGLLMICLLGWSAVGLPKPPNIKDVEQLGQVPAGERISLRFPTEVAIPRTRPDEDQWLIPAGDYDLSLAVRVEGQVYFLLPYWVRTSGQTPAARNSSVVKPIAGGCGSQRMSALLIDATRRALYPHVLEVRRSTCTKKERLAWRNASVSLDLAPYLVGGTGPAPQTTPTPARGASPTLDLTNAAQRDACAALAVLTQAMAEEAYRMKRPAQETQAYGRLREGASGHIAEPMASFVDALAGKMASRLVGAWGVFGMCGGVDVAWLTGDAAIRASAACQTSEVGGEYACLESWVARNKP